MRNHSAERVALREPVAVDAAAGRRLVSKLAGGLERWRPVDGNASSDLTLR